MRRGVLALAVVGLVSAAAAILPFAPAREQPAAGAEAVGKMAVAPPVQEAPRAPAPVPAPLPAQPRVRAVAPEVVAPPRLETEGLERVEARLPLSTHAAPSRKRRNHGVVFRPVIEAAGRLAGSGLVIDIVGIAPTDSARICTDASGAEWTCGVRARTAFRAFVRGRALKCDLPDELDEDRYTTSCALGQQDVGAWLAAQGWAEALADGPYAEAGAAARAAGKGIFGAAPVIEPLPDPEPFVSALPEPPAPPAAVE